MRKKVMAANWKMNKTRQELAGFFTELQEHMSTLNLRESTQVVVSVPYVFLQESYNLTRDSSCLIASQNVHWAESGAYTGEVSLPMIQDLGINTTLIGHSERRSYYNETNESVAKKIQACQSSGVKPILCVGETLEEREQDKTSAVIEEQLTQALADVQAEFVRDSLIVAYEPVWAIGTGLTASPEQAQEVHQYARSLIAQKFDEEVSQSVAILYGGSMKPANAAELLAQADVDGGLVGGASLQAESFAQLVKTLNES